MAVISVSRRDGDTFTVAVDDARFTVDASPANSVVAAHVDVDRAALVVESFRFLLEREPASSILSSFSLDDITRYFPEYPGEIAARLS